MTTLLQAADTTALVVTNALLGLALVVVALAVLAAVIRYHVTRRRHFTRTVRDVDNEVRTMFHKRGD